MTTYYERINKKIPHLDMITLIKIIAIMYISVIDILTGFFISVVVDKYIFPKSFSKDDDKKSIIRLISEISLIISTFSVLAYIARNIIQLIPFPLDDKYGFKYDLVTEVKSGALIMGSLILYCSTLFSKIIIIRNKLGKNNK